MWDEWDGWPRKSSTSGGTPLLAIFGISREITACSPPRSPEQDVLERAWHLVHRGREHGRPLIAMPVTQ